jgi:Na+-transporting NADH:ubiquinone oxidoreductase subunit B
VDGFSGATLLGELRILTEPFESAGYSWTQYFIGLVPGSLGETSALACLIGAVIIAVTKVGSWRIMLGAVLGTIAMALVFNSIGSTTNQWYAVPFWWHMVVGGWAFGVAFMATDPVTAPFADKGKWIYGFMIGALIVLIRVVNPGLSGIRDARDPVHERDGAGHRPRLHRREHEPPEAPCASLIPRGTR